VIQLSRFARKGKCGRKKKGGGERENKGAARDLHELGEGKKRRAFVADVNLFGKETGGRRKREKGGKKRGKT